MDTINAKIISVVTYHDKLVVTLEVTDGPRMGQQYEHVISAPRRTVKGPKRTISSKGKGL